VLSADLGLLEADELLADTFEPLSGGGSRGTSGRFPLVTKVLLEPSVIRWRELREEARLIEPSLNRRRVSASAGGEGIPRLQGLLASMAAGHGGGDVPAYAVEPTEELGDGVEDEADELDPEHRERISDRQFCYLRREGVPQAVDDSWLRIDSNTQNTLFTKGALLLWGN